MAKYGNATEYKKYSCILHNDMSNLCYSTKEEEKCTGHTLKKNALYHRVIVHGLYLKISLSHGMNVSICSAFMGYLPKVNLENELYPGQATVN